MEIYELAEKLSAQEIGETPSASSEAQVEEILSSISDQQCSDSGSLEVDSLVDVYYSSLLDWVSDDEHHVEFVEDAVSEGLVDTSDFDFYAAVQAGQHQQYRQVAQEVFEWLEEELAEREEAEEEE